MKPSTPPRHMALALLDEAVAAAAGLEVTSREIDALMTVDGRR